jgi:tetratricopeptide (TPR) repeat protein
MNSAERHTYRLGRQSFERGDNVVALAQFTRLLETRQGYADVHYMVGVLHERQADFAAAASSLEHAVRLNPNYTEALLALASVFEQQGDFDRSQQIADRARLASRPGDGVLDATTRGKLANLQAALGNAFREAGELREAIEAYRRALDRCPEFHDIRHRLGIALREAGLPHHAIAEYRRVLRANPEFLDAAVQLGFCLYTLGRTDEAKREWLSVSERDPEREDARMYLRLVRSPTPG